MCILQMIKKGRQIDSSMEVPQQNQYHSPYVRLFVPNATFRNTTLDPWEVRKKPDANDNPVVAPIHRLCGWMRCLGRRSVVLDEGTSLFQKLPITYSESNEYVFALNDGFGDAPYRRRIFLRLYADDEIVAEKSGILVENSGNDKGLNACHTVSISSEDFQDHVGKFIGLEFGVEDGSSDEDGCGYGANSSGSNNSTTGNGREYYGKVSVVAVRLSTRFVVAKPKHQEKKKKERKRRHQRDRKKEKRDVY